MANCGKQTRELTFLKEYPGTDTVNFFLCTLSNVILKITFPGRIISNLRSFLIRDGHRYVFIRLSLEIFGHSIDTPEYGIV